MRPKILLGLLSVLTIAQPLYAARSSFYVGLNGANTIWHVKHNLNVPAASAPSANWDSHRYLLNGEVLAGIKASNGSVYGAIETWYNPSSNRVAMANNSINFSTTIANRWGGRLLAGVQSKNVTLYGIVGLSQVKIATQTSFPAGGIYGTLNPNSFASNEIMFSAGIGLNATFYERWDVAFEYQHHDAENHTPLSNTLPAVGTQTAKINGDSINFAIRYQFQSYRF